MHLKITEISNNSSKRQIRSMSKLVCLHIFLYYLLIFTQCWISALAARFLKGSISLSFDSGSNKTRSLGLFLFLSYTQVHLFPVNLVFNTSTVVCLNSMFWAFFSYSDQHILHRAWSRKMIIIYPPPLFHNNNDDIIWGFS